MFAHYPSLCFICYIHQSHRVFFFYIQLKYCAEKCCIFFQATLLYKIVELLTNGAGDYWIKIVIFRHIGDAECWNLEGKFTDIQHCHNVHNNVHESRLHNPNLSLWHLYAQDLKSILISVWRRKVSYKRHFVSGSYKNMCTVNISNRQVKQKFDPSLQFGIFLQGTVVARDCLYEVLFDICYRVHSRVFSDDCVWYFIAAVCSRPPCRGTEGKRHFHVISHLVTSRPAGTCIGKPVFLLQDEHILRKGCWREYLNLSSKLDYPTLSLLSQC